MTQIKPLSSMETPRFADVATFFRLPVVKDLNKLDYCVAGVPWDGGTTNRPGARHGPREIRNASSLVRLYHPVSLKSPYDKFNIADIGDCPVNPADLSDSLNKIEKFDVGQSNPTYLLHCDNKKIVLRSKPMGNLLRGAHRIDREYRVMSALRETKIPVPNMIIYCDENKIIGSEFFLMDFIDGIKEKKPILENYSKDEKKKIYKKKSEVLVNLAKLDLKKYNLEDYGKKSDYLFRQIDLWIKPYRASETQKIEAMEFLIENLGSNIPKIFEKFNDF